MPAVHERIKAEVRERAGGQCEYCMLPSDQVLVPFEVEHIMPLQHGDTDALGNLAYSCLHCNRHKGPNLSAIDRVTSKSRLIRLFNPRRHVWTYHFAFDGPRLRGLTPIGRVTVNLLQMNAHRMVALRMDLLEEDSDAKDSR